MNTTTTEEGFNPFLNRKSGAAELFLIRHGDALPGPEVVLSDNNYDGRGLSELGKAQAEALAKELVGLEFHAIYSSPLLRTRETAAPLAKVKGLEVLVETDLREVELGTAAEELRMPNGVDPADTAAAMRARQYYIASTAGRTGYWSSIPGSEPSEQFRRRVVNITDSIAAKHSGQRVAIFSHGGVINVYLAELLGIKRDFFFPILNTSVNVVRVAGKQRVLRSINDVCHLRAANLSADI